MVQFQATPSHSLFGVVAFTTRGTAAGSARAVLLASTMVNWTTRDIRHTIDGVKRFTLVVVNHAEQAQHVGNSVINGFTESSENCRIEIKCALNSLDDAAS